MSYSSTRRPIYDTACRFQDGVTLEVMGHGHGVRLQFRRDEDALASVFLDEMDAKLMLNALAQHFGANAPCPTVGLARQAEAAAIAKLLARVSDALEQYHNDKPF